MKEMVGGCCVCSDERGWPDNPLVYCDGNGCTVAVHQACYGIVTVPTGPWYCRKCESPDTKGKVKCELCPSKSGALKRTDTGGWAHVVCALYIPEVRFGNVTSMEPIVLRLIPAERYNKTCYICQDLGKNHRATAGACMQCNKSGCKQQFHVTCAQSLGLLCEEAGNYLDNVKYCGYCQHHYSKLKKGGNVKTIPPYKPVSHDSQSSDSSCEKEGEASPVAGGSGTPTHATKSKGPGRKSSAHASTSAAAKSTPNPAKTPTNTNQPMAGGSTPGGSKVTPPAASPSAKPVVAEPVGVINAAPPAASIPLPTTSAPAVTTTAATSVVHNIPPNKLSYQESVITNAEAMDTKQTKKRKAVSAANTPTAPVDYATVVTPGASAELNPQSNVWEGAHPREPEIQADPLEKIVKKAKTEGAETVTMTASHFSSVSPAPPPPPPPPANSPASHPSPRPLPSPMPSPMAGPMPGPSGIYVMSNIRSPQQPQAPVASDMTGLSPHIFHQPQKQAAMEPSMPSHVPHNVPVRSAWGGLNVTYEMQQDTNKPGVSGVVAGPSKDMGLAGIPMPPTTIRTKKRAAMAASVVNMANNPPPQPMMQTAPQSLATVRRPPQPTPPPIYQETIKDSPPSSPSSERPLKPKMENHPRYRMGVNCSAPHMLGNELNPESGAAARLQEQLSAELAAHAAGGGGVDALVPPPLINKAGPGVGMPGRSSSGAQSLDQLLERQWEQGSQFLMEQAQHFDIASLLSCLHQLRTENVRLEDHVGSLLQRRDHLLAVNARLAIPLTTGQYPDALQMYPVASGPPEQSRCPRENGAPVRPPPGQGRAPETITSERSHQLMMREVQQKPS